MIVAPTEYDSGILAPPLPYQVQEIVDALTAFYTPEPPLVGRVTERQLANCLRDGVDIFWFVGHGAGGAQGGLLLSDGYASGQTVGRYLGRAGVRWAYLNACDSASLVETIQAIHPDLDIYANITSIDDKEAARNAMLLAQGIADLGRVQKAYRSIVAGGGSKLRYFPAPNIEREGVGSVREHESTERRLQRLERIVLGDEDTGLPGWLAQMAMINRRLRRIEFIMIASAVVLAVAILMAGVMISRPTVEQSINYRPAPTPTPFYYPQPIPAPIPPVPTLAPATPIPWEDQ